MIHVKIKDTNPESFEKGMKIFKKLCQKDGFMNEIRERRYYKKPSEKKREAIRKAIREQQKEAKKDKREE